MDAIKELHEVIAYEVKAGYDDREAIISHALELMLIEYDPDWLLEQAIHLTDNLLRQHYESQRNWRGITDNDRLDEAFADLDRNGIVARQNFSCCQTCGHREIGTEILATEAYRPVRGYVFFHVQDTELAVQGGTLYLAYGSVSGKERESLAIADEAVLALYRAGLRPHWNGSVHKRIRIDDFFWQRRRLPFKI